MTKHNESQSNRTAKQLLDQRAKDLSDRHSLRLKKMTSNAEAYYFKNQSLKDLKLKNKSLNHRFLNKYRINFRQLTIPLMLASSAMFVFWLWWPAGIPTRLQNDPAIVKFLPSDTRVPEWVMDTSLPISLLNNRAFFDWLSKQGDAHKRG